MKRKDYISWDEYFMGIAKLSGMRSKDPNTQVGACIVSEDNKILSMGYNGFPIGCSDEEFGAAFHFIKMRLGDLQREGWRDLEIRDDVIGSSIHNTEEKVTVKCPNCGTTFDSGLAFCPQCGAKFVVQSEKRYCIFCGAEIVDGARFCGVCGAAVA